MDIYDDAIRGLPAADKLLLVERIWCDLLNPPDSLPISDDVIAEAKRRREEMLTNPALGKTHDEVWGRIEAWRNA